MNVIQQIGYYDGTEPEPAHNPCTDAPCCVCGLRNGDAPMSYRSVLVPPGRRSYFFGFHTGCKGSPKLDDFEQAVVTEAFDWDDLPCTPPTNAR